MSHKFIVRKGIKYLNSIKFLDENLNFIPYWSIKRENAFLFEKEFDAQRIAEEFDESEIKWEVIDDTNFKKSTNFKFINTKRNFEKLLAKDGNWFRDK